MKADVLVARIRAARASGLDPQEQCVLSAFGDACSWRRAEAPRTARAQPVCLLLPPSRRPASREEQSPDRTCLGRVEQSSWPRGVSAPAPAWLRSSGRTGALCPLGPPNHCRFASGAPVPRINASRWLQPGTAASMRLTVASMTHLPGRLRAWDCPDVPNELRLQKDLPDGGRATSAS